ncbi:hypothetical protein EV368DRAFT_42294, partial [Lentinula lateritia]
ITLNNASNNNTMMASLEFELTVHDVPFHRDGNCIQYVHSVVLCPIQHSCYTIRCSPYVINIAKNGMHECADDNDNADGLLECIVILLWDVDPHWSSTFFMTTFLSFIQILFDYISNPSSRLSSMLFFAVDIQVLNDIREYLYLFHAIQELASAEKTPTLPIVLPLYKGLIEMLGLMKSTLPNLAHIIEVSLRKLHEYVDKARGTQIYALAMAINPTMKLNWINENWP